MPPRVLDPTRRDLQVRDVEDLEVAARALAFHFQTDMVVVVGSQSVLVGWPDAPILMRTSPEIDAYPANARVWEAELNAKALSAEDQVEASEEINAWFGDGSDFARRRGFYIDGVDDGTAKLPPGWQERAVYRHVQGHGKTVTVVAPAPSDMVVSKLARLVEKDRAYIEALHQVRPLDRTLLMERLASRENVPEIVRRAKLFLDSLPGRPPSDTTPLASVPLPACPPSSHCRFVGPDGAEVNVRKWDRKLKLFYRLDNPLGPAVIGPGPNDRKYYLDGQLLDEAQWAAAPEVIAARPNEPAGPIPPWAGGSPT